MTGVDAPSKLLQQVNERLVLAILAALTQQEELVRTVSALVTELAKTNAAAAAERRESQELCDDFRRSLQSAHEHLEEINQLKTEFLSVMSHELRTPLNSILGFTEIVLLDGKGTIPDEQQKQLRIVLTSAGHLLSLINNILEVSRLEAGQTMPQADTFVLADLVSQSIATLQASFEEKGLELRTLGEMASPIRSDRMLVQQILLGLLNNALKFTERGFVEVRYGEYEGGFEIAVCDTGIGIEATQQRKVFGLFQLGDSSASRTHQGTGLGLYLCKKRAALLDGAIALQSSPAGSTFTVRIPQPAA